MQDASPAALAGRQVLIVERDPCAAEDLQRALAVVGAEVVGIVASPAEAVDLAEGPARIDIAILEVEPDRRAAAAAGHVLRDRGAAVLLASIEGAAAAAAIGDGLPCAAKPVDLHQVAAALWLSAPPCS
jgi:AmiR/NasT family two-component response regulator